MSSTSTGPGFELKHRIAGAVILIGFAVIVLPMVLGGPGPELRGSAPEPAPADDPDTKVFVSKITPIGGSTPATRPAPPPVAATARPESPPKLPATPEPTPVVKNNEPEATISKATPNRPAEPAGKSTSEAQAEKKVTTAKATTVEAEPQLDRGWIVQVGVFSKSENAEKLSALLKKRGFKPVSGRVKTMTGGATRVWIGPYAQRVEAARMRSRVEQAIGEKGLIVAYP